MKAAKSAILMLAALAVGSDHARADSLASGSSYLGQQFANFDGPPRKLPKKLAFALCEAVDPSDLARTLPVAGLPPCPHEFQVGFGVVDRFGLGVSVHNSRNGNPFRQRRGKFEARYYLDRATTGAEPAFASLGSFDGDVHNDPGGASDFSSVCMSEVALEPGDVVFAEILLKGPYRTLSKGETVHLTIFFEGFAGAFGSNCG